MKCDDKMSKVIKGFFCERLESQREASINTINTYKDCIKMFLKFLMEDNSKELEFSMINAENIVAFLQNYLDNNHRAISRNQRLMTLKSFAQYATYKYPEDSEQLKRILYISPIKEVKKVVSYLTVDEMEEILNIANDNDKRHYAILLFMYNTGARVSEVTSLNISQLHLKTTQSVLIYGKGKKERVIPLWKEMVKILKELIKGRDHLENEPVFLNNRGERLNRKGISYILSSNVNKAQENRKSLCEKIISPHTIRHTTAMHLLQSGVSLNSIRLWLGHVSVATTNIYVEADLEMKKKVLAKAKKVIPAFKSKRWKEPDDFDSFLENLLE